MKESQNTALMKHLLAGKRITQGDALTEYGIGRLASRISDLKDRGVKIRSEFIKVQKRDGTTASVKEYWLAPETIKAFTEGRK